MKPFAPLFAALDAPHDHRWAEDPDGSRRAADLDRAGRAADLDRAGRASPRLLGRRAALRGLAAAGLGVPLLFAARRVRAACSGTDAPAEVEGPYFLGEPELRTATGSGLIIRGTVTADGSCAPIAGARIVRWQANRTGIYEDYYRATMLSDGAGAYALQTIVPGIYAGLPRHVHFHISAPGYQDLITQIRWVNGAPPAENTLNFVLRPA